MIKVVCEGKTNNTEIKMEGSLSEVYAELCMAVLRCIEGLAEKIKQDDATVTEVKSVLIDDFTDMLKEFK